MYVNNNKDIIVNQLNNKLMEKLKELSFNDQIKINGGVFRPYFWLIGGIEAAIANGIDAYTKNIDHSHAMARRAI